MSLTCISKCIKHCIAYESEDSKLGAHSFAELDVSTRWLHVLLLWFLSWAMLKIVKHRCKDQHCYGTFGTFGTFGIFNTFETFGTFSTFGTVEVLTSQAPRH